MGRRGQSGASACDGLPVRRMRSELGGTLEGNKAHGWIGCAASETAAVHYGLVSGVKPCSWAASSRTSSLCHLATGGAGAGGQRPIPGGVLLAARQHGPEARRSAPAPICVLVLGRGCLGSSFLAACCWELALGASLEHSSPGRVGFGRREGARGMDADFLANAEISVPHLYQALRLRQPTYSPR